MIQLLDLKYDIEEGNRERRILDIDDSSFFNGKIYIIHGPSGSGKTTLLYALAGILDITSGQVLFNGTSIYDLNSKERDRFRMDYISMVYQNYNLFSFMNVEDNILAPYYLKGNRISKVLRDECHNLLRSMNLPNVADKSIQSLSGGEQQRIAILRSLFAKPKVILCDEPTANLDSENTHIFMKNLIRLNKDSQTTIIIATHDEKVMEYGDCSIELIDGKIHHVEGGYSEVKTHIS